MNMQTSHSSLLTVCTTQATQVRIYFFFLVLLPFVSSKMFWQYLFGWLVQTMSILAYIAINSVQALLHDKNFYIKTVIYSFVLKSD